MTIRATFSEHDDEPVRGLPSALPSGEYVLWQGAPSWRSLALHAYRVKLLSVYFALIVIARGVYLLSTGSSLLESLQGCVGPAVLSMVCLAIVTGIARLAARATVYTITSRRLVIRQGIALSSTINLPFKAIESAQIMMRSDGSGDIALTVECEQRVSYLWLWPHVRPGYITRPQPCLRSLPNAERAGEILGQAYTQHTPGTTLESHDHGSQEASATGTVLGASA